MEKRELSHTVGGNVSWCGHYGVATETSTEVPQKTKIELPYDPGTLFLAHIQTKL